MTQPRNGRCEIYDDGVDEILFSGSGYASSAATVLGVSLLVVLAVVAVRGTGGSWLRSSSVAILVATVLSAVVFVGWAFLCFAPGGVGF